jgi:apolipoprotein N-acyltransferase
VSNDAWFGETNGPWQHLQIARVRALENGRPLLRATNNGVTAVIDKTGNIVEALPQFEPGVLSTSVTFTSGRTPYSYLGDWPVLVLILLFLLWGYKTRDP